MAVMTPAPNADYLALSALAQDQFDVLMEQADEAGPADYAHLMKAIATLTGLTGSDLRKCACSCWCGAIFDANDSDAHVIEHGTGYNLGRHQCGLCADRHRETA